MLVGINQAGSPGCDGQMIWRSFTEPTHGLWRKERLERFTGAGGWDGNSSRCHQSLKERPRDFRHRPFFSTQIHRGLSEVFYLKDPSIPKNGRVRFEIKINLGSFSIDARRKVRGA